VGSPDDRDWPAELVRENIQAFGNHKYFQRLKDLRAKSVFVCTMWFDGKGYWEKALADSQRRPVPVVTTTGFDNISVLINRSLRFTGVDGRQWSLSNEYVDKNVTVLETHMPSAESMASLTNKEIAALCYQDVKQLVPGLPEPKGSYVNRWDTYLKLRGGRGGEAADESSCRSTATRALVAGNSVYLPGQGTG
jgi:hypothetical protein